MKLNACSNRVITKVFGNKHERDVKRLQPHGRSDQRARDRDPGAFRPGPARQDRGVPPRARRRQDPRRSARARFRGRPRGGSPGRSACGTTTSSWSAAWSCTRARSPRCGPARARRSSPLCRVYLNALAGKGVHIVTVNDYLARRDAEWMGRIYRFLGLAVGVVQHDISDAERRAAYAGRHHLRHEQRARLRLPARQHEVRPRRDGAARSLLRHRRRGRLDPHRRGPHAARSSPARPRSRSTSTTRSTGSSPSSSAARRSRTRTGTRARPATSWSTRRPTPWP